MYDEERLKSANIKLQYVTHHARNIMAEIGNDLNIYWQVRLMEMCHNHNLTVVNTLLTKAQKMSPGLPLSHLMHINQGAVARAKKYSDAFFTTKAILHLWTLDSSMLSADYTTRLDALSRALDRMDADDMNAILSMDKCSMPLLLIKIEDYLGERDKQWANTRKMAKIPKQDIPTTSEEDRQRLKQLADDLQQFSPKRRVNGT